MFATTRSVLALALAFSVTVSAIPSPYGRDASMFVKGAENLPAGAPHAGVTATFLLPIQATPIADGSDTALPAASLIPDTPDTPPEPQASPNVDIQTTSGALSLTGFGSYQLVALGSVILATSIHLL